MTRTLTLNLGLRYDWASNAVAAGNVPLEGLSNPLTNTAFVPLSNVVASNPNSKNFDPRIGLAWDPFKDHKTSVRAGFGMFHEPLAARTYASAFDLTPPTETFEATGQPFPCFPNTPCFNGGSAPAVFAGLDYNTKHAPYVMQYNLTIQRQITAGTVFTIGYNGSAGVHLFSEHDANPMLYQSEATFANGSPNPAYNPAASGPPGSLTNPFDGFVVCNLPLFPGFAYSGPNCNPSYTTPFINFAFANQSLGGDASDEATAHSSYNSLQAMLNRQFSHNLIGQVAYTWSRCIDNGSASSGLEQGDYEVTDTYDQSYDRGPCSFNVTQSFRINGIYSLPFKGNRAVTGWEVSPIFSASTGLPINVLDGLSAGGQAGLGGIEGPRPDMVPGCKPYVRTWVNWYNSNCYYLPPYGTLGNVGRDSLIGPGFMDLDFSVIKDTKLTEKVNLELRAEFFNILNHTSFGNPTEGFTFEGDAIGWPLVYPGTPSTNPADYQVTTVTPSGSLVCNSNTAFPGVQSANETCASPFAGQITYTSEPPREIQFSARFTF